MNASMTETIPAADVVANRFEALESLRVPFEEYLKDISTVVVETSEQYEAAAFGLTKLKTWEKDITDYFEPERKRTYDDYTAVTTTKKGFLDKAEAVEKVIKKKMGDFQRVEQERIRKAEEEALRKEEEARRELESHQPSPEQPVAISTVIIPSVPEPTMVSGISVGKFFTFRIVDASKVKAEFTIPDERKIAALVKAIGQGAVTAVGGIVVEEDIRISAGRR